VSKFTVVANLKKIKDNDKREKATPKYITGCKRIIVSDDYLPSLNRENTNIITDKLHSIT